MTSFAPIPEPDEIPDGMIHVGWLCGGQKWTGEPDECLMPLSRADEEPRNGEVHLYDANHHAFWIPVYAKVADGARVAPLESA